MNNLNVNFMISTVTPWKRDTAPAVTAEVLAEQINDMQAKIDAASRSPELENYVTDFKNFLRTFYLREVVIGEGLCDGKTSYEDVEALLARPAEDSKLGTKTHNLHRALDAFLHAPVPSDEEFTPQLLLNIHLEIGRGVIANCGNLRTKYVAPAGEDWIYLAPHLVPKALDTLCYNVRKALAKIDRTDLLGRIRIVASFMTNFLHIHPFSNGNGRVARIAVSWLLADITIVPIPIIASESGRIVYLDAIRDSRHSTPFLPANLARLLLESVHSTVRKAIFCLDI